RGEGALLGPVRAGVGVAETDPRLLDERLAKVASALDRGHHVRTAAVGDEAAVLLAERVDERRAREVVRERERSIVHDGGGGERRVPPARDGDRTELGGCGAELVHVPARDGREVHGLGKPAERDLDVLLDEYPGVYPTGGTPQ